jgi:Flp pilus assembly protein TadG
MIKNHIAPAMRNEDGVAAIEFALVSIPFFTLLLGAFDMGHTVYMRSVIHGALQEAARESSLQTGNTQANRDLVDTKVRSQIEQLNRDAVITASRRFYKTFTSANERVHEYDKNTATPSKENDGNCEASLGETFIDVNNNGVYDKDGGDEGQGGAQDAVIYTVNVKYTRIFPLATLLGLSNQINLSASTVLQNQPFSAQAQYGPATTRNCV